MSTKGEFVEILEFDAGNEESTEEARAEKAFAYKMKLEAMKSQGKRNDLTLSQLGTKLNKEETAEQLLCENKICTFVSLRIKLLKCI